MPEKVIKKFTSRTNISDFIGQCKKGQRYDEVYLNGTFQEFVSQISSNPYSRNVLRYHIKKIFEKDANGEYRLSIYGISRSVFRRIENIQYGGIIDNDYSRDSLYAGKSTYQLSRLSAYENGSLNIGSNTSSFLEIDVKNPIDYTERQEYKEILETNGILTKEDLIYSSFEKIKTIFPTTIDLMKFLVKFGDYSYIYKDTKDGLDAIYISYISTPLISLNGFSKYNELIEVVSYLYGVFDYEMLTIDEISNKLGISRSVISFYDYFYKYMLQGTILRSIWSITAFDNIPFAEKPERYREICKGTLLRRIKRPEADFSKSELDSLIEFLNANQMDSKSFIESTLDTDFLRDSERQYLNKI